MDKLCRLDPAFKIKLTAPKKNYVLQTNIRHTMNRVLFW